MSTKVEDIKRLIGRNPIAEAMTERYLELKNARKEWEDEKQEIRDYVFATDTTTTSNSVLPWKNTTTVPKLCQIRDNLQANYMAALFSNSRWLRWEPGNKDAVSPELVDAVTTYMRTKLWDSDFEKVVEKLILDYIDYGNAYAEVEWVNETFRDSQGVEQVRYRGPRLVRINPLDIVFDPTADDWTRTGKFIRRTLSMGDLLKYVEEHPDAGYDEAVLREIQETRAYLKSYQPQDINRAGSYMRDGFGSLNQYYNSGYVEIIEFEGDFYDEESMTLHSNRRITIVDRCKVLRNEPIENLIGRSTKEHVGWRVRQDNLVAMGPLDNLIGMQYRIDHLQNLKSDVFDLTAFPPLKIIGQVEDFEWGPFARIFMDSDADVQALNVDVNALSADIEIDWTEQKMEELAGAPRQALGIRTPGEKTKYEVQTLENNASRVFQSKITQFEKHFLEPLINSMLAVARENMLQDEIVRTNDPTFGYDKFLTVTPDMLRTKGQLRAIGARHFAERANMLQNYNNFRNSAAGSDPAVLNHISGKEEAQFVVEMLELDTRDFYRENVRIEETMESQELQQTGQARLSNQDQQLTLEEENLVDEQVAQQLPEGL